MVHLCCVSAALVKSTSECMLCLHPGWSALMGCASGNAALSSKHFLCNSPLNKTCVNSFLHSENKAPKWPLDTKCWFELRKHTSFVASCQHSKKFRILALFGFQIFG